MIDPSEQRILVADDMFYNQEALRAQFDEFGLSHQCTFFSNGMRVYDEVVQALDAAEGINPFSLMILDF